MSAALHSEHAATVAELQAALRAHDWEYRYSDDPFVFERGRLSWQHIEQIASRLPEKLAKELIAKRGKP